MHLEGPGDEPREWVVYPRRAALTRKVVDWVKNGDKLAIYCQSLKLAHALGRRFTKANSDANVAVVSSRTAGKYDLEDLSWVKSVDVLIYTPVLQTGVSIDIPDHFDHVAAYLSRDVGTADDALQGIARPRKPIDPAVHLWGPGGRRPERWETNPSEVRRRWLKRDEALRRRFDRDYPDQAHLATPMEAESYAQAMSVVVASDRARGQGWTTPALLALLRERDDTITEANAPAKADAAEKAESKLTGQARDEVVREHAEETVDAPELNDDAVQAVRRRGGPRGPEEAASLRQAGVQRFYGDVFDDADRSDRIQLVMDDKDGRRRAGLRRLAWASLAATEEGKAALLDLDHRDIVAHTSGIRLSARTMVGRMVVRLLEMAGVEGVIQQNLYKDPPPVSAGSPSEEIVLDVVKVTKAARWAEANRTTLQILEIPTRKNAATQPMRWLGDLLRWLGLGLRGLGRRTHRAGQVLERIRYIDIDQVKEAHRLAANYRRGLMARVDDHGADDDLREAEWNRYMRLLRENAEGARLAVEDALRVA